MPISHVSLPVADLQASSTFYLKTLAPLGYTLYKEIPDISVGFGIPRAGPDFWISKCPQQEERATEKGARPKIHVAFKASSQRMVHAFYEAALKAGGRCNGPPGERPQYVKGYYAAFVHDLDGHNIECMYWQPLWLTLLEKLPVAFAVAAVGAAWWAGKNKWMMA